MTTSRISPKNSKVIKDLADFLEDAELLHEKVRDCYLLMALEALAKSYGFNLNHTALKELRNKYKF